MGGGPTARNCALRRCRSSNMARPAENVVAFYDKRDACEQWIKEGKGARPVRVTLPARLRRTSAICAELPLGVDMSRIMSRHLRWIRLSSAQSLHLGLLRQLQGVFYLDAKVANRALELRVAQQELHGAQVLRLPINQRRLRRPSGRAGHRRGDLAPQGRRKRSAARSVRRPSSIASRAATGRDPRPKPKGE